MRLEVTRRGAYAVRAMIDLARAPHGTVVSATEIARRMGVPRGFLPQVMGDLVRAGMVVPQLGRGGGYRLAADPATITLLAIIEAVEGDTRRRECVLRGTGCGSGPLPCDVHATFAAAEEAFRAELGGETLAAAAGRGAGGEG